MRNLSLQCGRFQLSLEQPLVMGILNLTPDSFSDGGVYSSTEQQIYQQAERLVAEGAAILDVGAESTRPNATVVPVEEEWQRLAPILHELVRWNVPISVDTYKPEIMRRSLDLGVDCINDVQGFRTIEARKAVEGTQAALCVMHQLNQSAVLPEGYQYSNILETVSGFLVTRVQELQEHGISLQQIILDAGFGFAKSLEDNYNLMRTLNLLEPNTLPILVGVSRKNMIGKLLNRPVHQRLSGSLALAIAAVHRGARIVRVHDVLETVDALKVWQTVETGKP